MSLKSFYVKTLKDRFVSCCRHHVDFILLNDALNQMRLSRNLHDPNCSCSCVFCSLDFDPDEMEQMPCIARHLTYKDITSLWHDCLCPKRKGDKWHQRHCLLGECNLCGPDRLLPLCPEQEVESHNIVH
jgi:hypothetical protein